MVSSYLFPFIHQMRHHCHFDKRTWLLTVGLLVVTVSVNSCNDNNSTDDPAYGDPISLPFAPYDTPLGVGSVTPITGGIGQYRLTSIGDTSMLSGFIRTDNVLYLQGKKNGRTTIVINDEAGNSSGELAIDVKNFIVRPRQLTIPIRHSGRFSFDFGNLSVAAESQDTMIATVNNQFGIRADIYGRNFGSTTIQFKDVLSQSVQELPITVVELKPGELSFTSDLVSFFIKNGHVTDHSVSVAVLNKKTVELRSEIVKNADTTYHFSFSESIYPSITSGDTAQIDASLFINGKSEFSIAAKLVIGSFTENTVSCTYKGTMLSVIDTAKAPVNVSGSFTAQYYTQSLIKYLSNGL